jgi:hypothetical protein
LPLDIRFANARRNDEDVFRAHLAPYRDFSVVFADLEFGGLGWGPPATKPRDYCAWVKNDFDEDQDGDFDLVVKVDRGDLDAQPGF